MLSHPRRFVKTQFCVFLGLLFPAAPSAIRVPDHLVCRPDKIIVYHNLRSLSRANFGIKRPPVLRPRPASRRFLLGPASSGVPSQFLVIRRELLSAHDLIILARTLDAVKSRTDDDSRCHNVKPRTIARDGQALLRSMTRAVLIEPMPQSLSHLMPACKRPAQGHFVRILQITANRQTMSQPGNPCA